MPDRSPLTRRAALGLIGTGAIASLASTYSEHSVDADRTTVLATASDPANAYVGLEDLGAVVDDQNQATDIARIDNNLSQDLTLDVDVTLGAGIALDSDFDSQVTAGGATTLSVVCDPGSGSGTSQVDIQVNSASGASVTVENASLSFGVQRNCPGGPNAGSGFQSLSVGDVTHYTSPGDERQTVTFVPARDLNPNSDVTVDLSVAHPDGVDYTRTNWNFDVALVQGNGYISSISTDGVITYTTGSGNDRDRAGQTVELSVGSYATTTTAGPFQASITRQDRNETGTDYFSVVDDGSAPPGPVASDVSPNVSPGDERQTFEFTPGIDFDSGQLRIDLSEAHGNGVDYEANSWPDVRVDAGNGNAWWDDGAQEIAYQNGSDPAGQTIQISIGDYATAGSGGPYTVDFTRTDTGDTRSDTFEIQ